MIYLYKKYKKNNIYLSIQKNNIIFYISINKLQHKKIDLSYCYIQYVVDLKKKNATLISLKTKDSFKNKGFATKLLTISLDYLKQKKFLKIELDDMSDRAWEKKNIYINFGFKYINPFPEPEMILLI
jgi:ribosomal protein S18 acetylase RimI-like enzyme